MKRPHLWVDALTIAFLLSSIGLALYLWSMV